MIARFEQSEAMAGTKEPRIIEVESEWFQLTYDLLRMAPDGEQIASFNHDLDAWIHRDMNEVFSDIVIHEKELS